MDDLTQPLYLGEAFNVTRGRRKHRRPLSRWNLAGTILAVSVVLCGVVLVSWSLYQPFAHQGAVRDAQSVLEQQWNDPTLIVPDPSPTKPGDKKKKPPASTYLPVARLSIPSLGLSWLVIDGVEPSKLMKAPGRYPSSPALDKAGNYAIAGHREKGMFWDLDKVRPGEQIIVETKTMRYTYTVVSNKVTGSDAWDEVASVPPGFARGDKVLTLTTCNPKWDNYQRLIVHAELSHTQKV